MLEFAEFRHFIHKEFRQKPFDYTAYTERQLDEGVAKQILVDVNRGLWRFKSLFQIQNDSLCRTLQFLFNKFFDIIWAAQTPEVQEMYYQGLTDAFETLFAAFINPDSFNLVLDVFSVDQCAEKINFELIFDEPRVVFGYGIQLVGRLKKTTGLSIAHFQEITQRVIQLVKERDAELWGIVESVGTDTAAGMLLKQAISLDLH